MKNMMATMYDESFGLSLEDGGEGGGGAAVADAPPAAADAGGSATPAPDAPAPAGDGAAPAPNAGGKGEDTRTYTGKELGEKVSARLSEELKKHGVDDWKQMGLTPAEARQKLARLTELEKAFGGDKKADAPKDSPEVAKMKDWMYSTFPELREIQAIKDRATIADDRGYAQVAKLGDERIDALSKEAFGVTDAGQLSYFRSQVAASLMANKEDAQKWFRNGDISVVEKHFKTFKEAMEPILRATAARYVSDKKDAGAKIPPRMPAGGVPEPSSQKKAMTDDERVRGGFAFLRDQIANGAQ